MTAQEAAKIWNKNEAYVLELPLDKTQTNFQKVQLKDLEK